ncbi:MAG: hypothetical protein K0S56_2536 [Microvirga sp.]|nr:hypothetical protein [Microvirga sp.]
MLLEPKAFVMAIEAANAHTRPGGRTGRQPAGGIFGVIQATLLRREPSRILEAWVVGSGEPGPMPLAEQRDSGTQGSSLKETDDVDEKCA